MSHKKMKVVDRRMFTASGELRDEYRDRVDPDRKPEPVAPRPAPVVEAPTAASPVSKDVLRDAASPQEAPPEDPNGPKFADLIGLLAQTGASYIQQARASGSPDLLRMARLHIDLLGVLERKTAGNLTREEISMLEDVGRQLRLALG